MAEGSSTPPKKPLLPWSVYPGEGKSPKLRKTSFQKKIRWQANFISQDPPCASPCTGIQPCVILLSHKDKGSRVRPTGSRGHYLPRIMRPTSSKGAQRDAASLGARRELTQNQVAWVGSGFTASLASGPGQVTYCSQPQFHSGKSTLS
jgi:hypothetical protein